MENKNIFIITKTIRCSVTNNNKIALNRKNNVIIKYENGKLTEFEIPGTEFEVIFYKFDKEYSNNEIKQIFIEEYKYTPFLNVENISI